MSFASRLSLKQLFRKQVEHICNNLIARELHHCTCKTSFLRNKLRHFLARKVCSKNSLLAKDITRAQILDVDL